MLRNKRRDIIRLIINLCIIGLIIVGVVFLFRKCSKDENTEWELENHPLRVENIRKIAEISTVSYKDEVVTDTIEYYKDINEQISGNVAKLSDIENWKYSIRGSAIKRRLTLIVGGEVRYGFDLKDEAFKVSYSGDSVFVQLPAPKILDIIIVPSKTSIFQEHGDWHDNARRKLQKKAIGIFTRRSQNMDLEDKSKKQLESLLQKMITNNRKLIVSYQ